MPKFEMWMSKREIVEAVARAALSKERLLVPSTFTVNASYVNGLLVFGDTTLVEVYEGDTEITLHSRQVVDAVKEVFGGSRAGTNVLGGKRPRRLSDALRELLAFDDVILREVFDELPAEMRQQLRERLRW